MIPRPSALRSRAAYRIAAALAVTAALGAACSTGVRERASPEPSAAVTVTRGSLRRRAERAAEVPAFWTAVALVDAAGAAQSAESGEERLFADGYRALTEGRAAEALVVFDALSAARDDAIRRAAHTGRTIALESAGRWADLAVDDAAEAPDRDHASIARWARAFANAAPVELRAPARGVDLPLQLSEMGTPIVTVRVNGTEHAFWLDTGASLTILSDAMARELGIAALNADTLAVATWAGRVPARAALVDRLDLGPVSVRNLPVAVLEAEVLRFEQHREAGDFAAGVKSVRLDGVLGTDVLRRLAVTLDVPARVLTVSRPPAKPPAGRARNVFWLGFPVVRVLTSGGRSALFGLDTGADSTFVGESWFLVDTVLDVTARHGELVGLGATSLRTVQAAREVLLSDGAYTVHLRNVAVAPERRTTFVTLDGVLGTDFIRGAQVQLDITNGVFAVRPSRPRTEERPFVVYH